MEGTDTLVEALESHGLDKDQQVGPLDYLTSPVMRCVAYCVSGSYNLAKVHNFLKLLVPVFSYGEALHFNYKQGEVFCFNYGCVVLWNTLKEDDLAILEKVFPFSRERLPDVEFDEFIYSYGSLNKMIQDEITLLDPKDTLAKLSVSYGLAQSTKLSVYESKIEGTLQATELITNTLASKGKIPLSRRAIGRKIGELFLERNTINVRSDFLEPPEFFWEYPEYEPLYKMTASDLDIRIRAVSLNRKLDMIHDLYQILGDEMNQRQSARLEWVIIALILIEVMFASYDFFLPH